MHPGTPSGGINGNAMGVGKARHVREGGEYIGVARECPELSFGVVVERRLLAQPAIEGIGILVECARIGGELDHGFDAI